MSKSTVCVIVKEVCSCIVELLLPDYIKVPTGSALKAGFKSDHGFPQLLMELIFLFYHHMNYYNRKG